MKPNFSPEPTAAAPLAFRVGGGFTACRLRRRSVSGSCGSAPRCYRTQLLTMLLALLPVLAQAKHVNPPAVPAITNSGVRYVVPNDKGLHAYVEAWSITTGQKLWTKKIFTHWYIPPFGTECMHYEWIKSMAMLEDDLVLTSERGRIYKLNIHTRSVRRAKTPNPATSGA